MLLSHNKVIPKQPTSKLKSNLKVLSLQAPQLPQYVRHSPVGYYKDIVRQLQGAA